MTFQQFMRRVDVHLYRLAFVVSDEIDDFDYAAAWEDKKTPMETAKAALKNAGAEAWMA